MSTYDFEPNPEDYGPEPAHIANGTHKKTLLVASPKREWVGLTKEAREECEEWLGHAVSSQVFYVIEAKLKEKNT